jgi:hypothetical protein
VHNLDKRLLSNKDMETRLKLVFERFAVIFLMKM